MAEKAEKNKIRDMFSEVRVDAENLADSITDASEQIQVVAQEVTSMSSVMQEFTASLQEMSSNIIEVSDAMEEMDEMFMHMSEEAKDGADYAQNSNNEAYDIMKKSEAERHEVEAMAIERKSLLYIKQQLSEYNLLKVYRNSGAHNREYNVDVSYRDSSGKTEYISVLAIKRNFWDELGGLSLLERRI